jgi:hypothetical protein
LSFQKTLDEVYVSEEIHKPHGSIILGVVVRVLASFGLGLGLPLQVLMLWAYGLSIPGPLYGVDETLLGRVMNILLCFACLTWIGSLALFLLQPKRTVGALISVILRRDKSRLSRWAMAWVGCFCAWIVSSGVFVVFLILLLV